MTFSDRIEAVLADGDMTVGDLRWWFERPYPTVRLWRFGNIREPTGARGREALRRLKLLETAIANRNGFPVPASLSLLERPEYLKKVRDGLENPGVPSRRSA